MLRVWHTLAAAGRIGRPVFLRLAWGCDGRDAAAQAAAAICRAGELLGEQPAVVFARGEAAIGCLHVLVSFPSGATALLICGPGTAAEDAVLLGNRGAAYADGGEVSVYQRLCGATAEAHSPSPTILAALEKALRTGAPVRAEGCDA